MSWFYLLRMNSELSVFYYLNIIWRLAVIYFMEIFSGLIFGDGRIEKNYLPPNKLKEGDLTRNHSMPGTPTQACYLRRRRREVALFCTNISRKFVPLLDAKPTLTLRLGHNILTY
ncbi:MAG TPA: hypothetical protein DCZ08_11115 [Anaerolineaceae bacterium]|nr:hypothetical protein [Anaerolineaceae bacterium]